MNGEGVSRSHTMAKLRHEELTTKNAAVIKWKDSERNFAQSTSTVISTEGRNHSLMSNRADVEMLSFENLSKA